MYLKPPEPPKPKQSYVSKFMRQNESYSVGNRVYNGSAPSPHAGGGLDKSGYAVRDAMARTTKQNLLKDLIKKNQQKGM
jgi:hypothetical protein